MHVQSPPVTFVSVISVMLNGLMNYVSSIDCKIVMFVCHVQFFLPLKLANVMLEWVSSCEAVVELYSHDEALKAMWKVSSF